jgi:hypothetical protein
VAPIHQGVAPVGVLHATTRTLPEVALDVGADLLHVLPRQPVLTQEDSNMVGNRYHETKKESPKTVA